MGYGNCNNDTCWYSNNLDRVNEYVEEHEVRCVNNDDNYAGHDVVELVPYKFMLCEVCFSNCEIEEKCKNCDRWMLDNGFFGWCRLCINKWAKKVDDDAAKEILEIEWEDLFEHERAPFFASELLPKLADAKDEHVEKKARCRSFQKQKARDAVDRLTKDVSSETKRKIYKIVGTEIVDDLEELLLILIC